VRDKNTQEESLKKTKRVENKPKRRRRSGEGRNKGEDRRQQSIEILIHQKLLNTIEN